MGQTTSRSVPYKPYKKTVIKVFMNGLGSAGKTTLLYKLKFGEEFTDIPVIGQEIQRLTHNDVIFSAWDVGGRCGSRPLNLMSHRRGLDAILTVVDSTDRSMFEDIKIEMERVMRMEDLQNTVFLVLCNKQDLPDAARSSEVAEALDVDQMNLTHKVHVVECSAVTGAGLSEALDWLSVELAPRLTPPDTEEDKTTEASGKETTTEQEKKGWSFKSFMKGGLGAFRSALSKNC